MTSLRTQINRRIKAAYSLPPLETGDRDPNNPTIGKPSTPRAPIAGDLALGFAAAGLGAHLYLEELRAAWPCANAHEQQILKHLSKTARSYAELLGGGVK